MGKLKIKRNTKKAAKSKIPTILNKNAIPSRKPESIKIFFFSLSFAVKIRKPDKIIGRSIKFSEFAIFPSTIGKAKRSPKIIVEKIAILFPSFSSKSFLESAKKAINESTPKTKDTRRRVNWSELKRE